jgi:hypothetical protein
VSLGTVLRQNLPTYPLYHFSCSSLRLPGHLDATILWRKLHPRATRLFEEDGMRFLQYAYKTYICLLVADLEFYIYADPISLNKGKSYPDCISLIFTLGSSFPSTSSIRDQQLLIVAAKVPGEMGDMLP